LAVARTREILRISGDRRVYKTVIEAVNDHLVKYLKDAGAAAQSHLNMKKKKTVTAEDMADVLNKMHRLDLGAKCKCVKKKQYLAQTPVTRLFKKGVTGKTQVSTAAKDYLQEYISKYVFALGEKLHAAAKADGKKSVTMKHVDAAMKAFA